MALEEELEMFFGWSPQAFDYNKNKLSTKHQKRILFFFVCNLLILAHSKSKLNPLLAHLFLIPYENTTKKSFAIFYLTYFSSQTMPQLTLCHSKRQMWKYQIKVDSKKIFKITKKFHKKLIKYFMLNESKQIFLTTI